MLPWPVKLVRGCPLSDSCACQDTPFAAWQLHSHPTWQPPLAPSAASSALRAALTAAGAATTPSTLCRVTNFIEDIDKVHRDPTTTAQRHQAQRTAADAQQRRAEDARILLRQRAAAAADLGAVEMAWLAFKKADREGCGKLKASEFAQVGCRLAC